MPGSLDDLAVFARVAEAKSLSAAARTLGLPKSSVSRALARLERELGAELVQRTTRRLRLTAAGEALVQRAEPHLSALSDVVSHVPGEQETPVGLLRLTCTNDFGSAVLAELVVRFVARYPLVQVEVHASNTIVDLISGSFDLAVRFSPTARLKDSSLSARRVGVLRTVLVASPSYVARRGAPAGLRDLGDHDWIEYEGIKSLFFDTRRGVERHAARGRVRCNDMGFARAAARAGAGIARLPSFLADPDVAAGDLVVVLPKWELSRGAVWVVHPAKRVVPAKVRAFRELVAEALRPTLRAQ